MSHELLESKMPGDYFAGNDDTYSSIKHEFSRIFHENNLHSFTNASDIGFLDAGKLAGHGVSDNAEESYLQSYQPYLGYQSYSYGVQQPAKGSASPFLTHLGSENYHNNIYSQSPMTHSQNQGPSITYSSGANKQVSAVPGSPGYYTYQGYQGYPHYGQAESPYLDYSTPTQSSHPAGQGYEEYSAHELIDSHPNNSLGMMWSNDAARGKEQNAEKAQYKVEQEFGSVSNKKLGQQIEKANKMNEDASTGLRRTSRVHTKTISYNNIGKEDDDYESGSDDDKEDGFGESKGRRSRGLRVLSLKVREIVSKKDKTSYKEVADALLEDLAQKMKGRPQAEIAKEEQNVKRRVYDALNVLIAADILQKEGKQVFLSNTRSFAAGKNQNKKKIKQDREGILDMIEAAKQRRQEKQDALQELVFKNLAVKNLIRKNKTKEEAEAKALVQQGLRVKRGVSQSNATRIDVVEENPSLKPQSQENISFPFIVIVSSSAENSMDINMDASQKQLSIDSRKPFDIYGDIDVLLKMKLHYVNKGMFEGEVPKQLRKYISPQFISELKK